jgi:hypothetical protein
MPKLALCGLLLLLWACRAEKEEDRLKIDQELRLYCSNAKGEDMWNPQSSSYISSFSLDDLNSPKELLSFSAGTKLFDEQRKTYWQYFDGAIRQLTDASNSDAMQYRSRFIINLNIITPPEKTPVLKKDTLYLDYLKGQGWFRLKRLRIGKNQVFEKQDQQPLQVKLIR